MSTDAPDDLYFVSPLVDLLFVGGASVLVFLYYRLTLTGYAAHQVSGGGAWLVGALVWIGNWPHFSATCYRLYESRAHVRQFLLTAVLIPVLIALATAACFWYPRSFAPYFIKLFVLWSPYHFSAQTLGITLIYARRAGLRVSSVARIALTIFFVSSFLSQYAETEISLSTGYMYAITFPQLHLPAWSPFAFELMTYAALFVLAYEILPQLSQLPRLPWIAACPILTQYLWFVYGAHDVTFQLFIPLFHSLQYMLIAWSIEMRSAADQRASPFKRSARWYVVNAAVGGSLFAGVPYLLSLRGWNLDYATLIVGAGISLHHYFVDGVIWKLRHEGARSPLFRNVAWALRGGLAG